MKKEKIEELFRQFSANIRTDIRSNRRQAYGDMRSIYDIELANFTQTISQIEKELKLEWYKKLEKKLQLIMESTPFNPIVNINPLTDYFNEIQNKIKELENEKFTN